MSALGEAMRRHPAGKARVPDYLTRVYDPTFPAESMVAHLVHSSGDDFAFCGTGSEHLLGWYGTGSQDEYETAAALDVCVPCRDGVQL